MKEEGTSGQVEKTVGCPADAPGRLIRYFLSERGDRAE